MQKGLPSHKPSVALVLVIATWETTGLLVGAGITARMPSAAKADVTAIPSSWLG